MSEIFYRFVLTVGFTALLSGCNSPPPKVDATANGDTAVSNPVYDKTIYYKPEVPRAFKNYTRHAMDGTEQSGQVRSYIFLSPEMEKVAQIKNGNRSPSYLIITVNVQGQPLTVEYTEGLNATPGFVIRSTHSNPEQILDAEFLFIAPDGSFYTITRKSPGSQTLRKYQLVAGSLVEIVDPQTIRTQPL